MFVRKIGHVIFENCTFKISDFYELSRALESLDSTTFVLLNILGIYLISDEWTKVEANL